MIFVGDPLQKAALSGDILYGHDLSPSKGKMASRQLPVAGAPKQAHFLLVFHKSNRSLLPKTTSPSGSDKTGPCP
jgi:hypothetical protein